MIYKIDDDYNPCFNVSELEIGALGRLIYDTSIRGDHRLCDKLIDQFISKVKKDFQTYEYPFTVKRQYQLIYSVSDYPVPRLLIHTSTDSVKDVQRIFTVLREYFQLMGNLRLAYEPYYCDEWDSDNNPVISYFPRGDNELTLLLDFTEYKCNEVYKDTIIM